MPKVSWKHLSKLKIPTYCFPTYKPDLYYMHYHLLQLQDKNRDIDVMHVRMRFSVIFKVFQQPWGWGFFVLFLWLVGFLFWFGFFGGFGFFLKPLQNPVTLRYRAIPSRLIIF